LTHQSFPCVENVPLEEGKFSDLASSDQFLIDLEFITRHAHICPQMTCIYPRSPAYLYNLGDLFPHIHFLVFRSTEVTGPEEEYDPDNPGMEFLSIQKGGVTLSPYPFTKELAYKLSRREPSMGLLFVCHAESQVRQLALHVLMQADFSLFDMNTLPQGYIHGELVFPIGLARGKCLVFLVTSKNSGICWYDEGVFKKEMGFFHSMVNEDRQYNGKAREFIIHQFALKQPAYEATVVKLGLLLTILDLPLFWGTDLNENESKDLA